MIVKLGKDPTENSQLSIMNTEIMESRRLFKFSNSLTVVSSQGTKVPFVANRSGNYRVWLSNLDGSDAKPISPTSAEFPLNKKSPLGRSSLRSIHSDPAIGSKSNGSDRSKANL